MNPNEKELILAVAQGKAHRVTQLLALQLDPDLKDQKGKSLLHSAVQNNRAEVVNILLKAGAKVDVRDKSKDTPLTLFLGSTRAKEPIIAISLVDVGANVNLKRTPKEWSPLHWAVYKNWPELVKKILEKEGDVNENENKNKNTPLHIALSETVGKLLIDNGAQVNAVNKKGLSPLESALTIVPSAEELGSSTMAAKDLCKLLIEEGADCNKIASNGLSVLMNAISQKLTDISIFLIDNGANVAYSHNKMGAAIHFSSAEDNSELLGKILDSGIDPNLKKKSDGYTPLHFAVANNSKKNVELLMSRGADSTIKNNFGQSPIDFARDMNDEEALRLLRI